MKEGFLSVKRMRSRTSWLKKEGFCRNKRKKNSKSWEKNKGSKGSYNYWPNKIQMWKIKTFSNNRANFKFDFIVLVAGLTSI